MTVKGQEKETDNFDVVTSEADDIGVDSTEKPIDTNSQKKEEEKPAAPEGEKEPKKEEGEDAKKDEDGKKAAGDTSAESNKQDQKRSPSRFQKRIDRKTKQAAAAEKRAEEAEKRAEAAEKKLAESGKADNANAEEPEPSDYDDYDDYLKALEDFNGNEPEKKAEPKPKEEPKKVAEAKADEKVDNELLDALDDAESSFETARERYADFNDVIGDKDVNITRDMVIAMSDADNAGDIAYHLGKNKDEANRIAELSPIAQAKEIGKLELKLAKKPPAEKKQTSAPDPIEPVGGSDGSDKALNDMSYSEFEETQNKKEASSSGFW